MNTPKPQSGMDMAKNAAKQLLNERKAAISASFNKYKASDVGKENAEIAKKGLDKGKDIAVLAQAKAMDVKSKAADYSKSDMAREHLNKAKKLAVSDMAKNIGVAVATGALAIIATGNGSKMNELNSKIGALDTVDKIAIDTKAVYQKDADIAKRQIENYTQNAGFGKKTIQQKLAQYSTQEAGEEIKRLEIEKNEVIRAHSPSEDIEAVEDKIKSLKKEKDGLEAASKDLTSSDDFSKPNITLRYAEGSMSKFSTAFGEGEQVQTEKEMKVLGERLADQKKLQDIATAHEANYNAEGTSKAADGYKEELKKAQSDATNNFIVGGLVGGAAFAFSRKKKAEGQKEKANPESDPTPEPINEPIQEMTQIQSPETVTEVTQILAESEVEPVQTNMVEEKSEVVAQVFEAKPEVIESVPEIAKIEEVKEVVIEAKADIKEPKKSLFARFGKLATQLTMGAGLFAGAPKIIDHVTGVKPIEKSATEIVEAVKEEANHMGNLASYNFRKVTGQDKVEMYDDAAKQNAKEAWAKQDYEDSKVKAKDLLLKTTDDKITEIIKDQGTRSKLLEENYPQHDMEYQMAKAKNDNMNYESNKYKYQYTQELEELKKIDIETTKLTPQQVEDIRTSMKSNPDAEQNANIEKFIAQNQQLQGAQVPAGEIQPTSNEVKAPTETTSQPVLTPEAAVTPPVAVPSSVQPEAVPAPAAEAPKVQEAISPEYAAAKIKVEQAAAETGAGAKYVEYTKKVTQELITNMSAILAEKGSTMSPQEVKVLNAKINAAKYLNSHLVDGKMYVTIAESAKATFKEAANGNPNSIFQQAADAKYGNFNLVKFGSYQFESGTMDKSGVQDFLQKYEVISRS